MNATDVFESQIDDLQIAILEIAYLELTRNGDKWGDHFDLSEATLSILRDELRTFLYPRGVSLK